jgi:hypothetical protein
MTKKEMERYCEIIAAFKLRTQNKKGHQISTPEAIYHLENHGIETPEGLVKAPIGILKKSTVNRYLALWHYNQKALGIETPATRFQASYSNECWQFDLSLSDLKKLDEVPAWMDAKRNPSLMLYSVVDDRSGVVYQEYHVVYGEDVYAALRFLFNAMAPKNIEGFPFQGIPKIIYTDNGPIAVSHLFQRVMKYLGIEIRRHMPRGKGGRRTEARSKGKVERPFRTVKEIHETLYHFHKPRNEGEANEWLLNFILRYNERDHRSESHSRIQDWLENLPPDGLNKMCSWERYCQFARKCETRIVGADANVSVNGILYEVSPELASQKVSLWWGLFDNEIFVEFEGQKLGPYQPSGYPVPLERYRKMRKTKAEARAEKIENLALEISLPKEALTKDSRLSETFTRKIPDNVPINVFDKQNPFEEIAFPNVISAKLAISEYLGKPLAKLNEETRDRIDKIVLSTLVKKDVISMINKLFTSKMGKD